MERWFVRKYLVINPKRSKLKILYRNFCLSKKQIYRKLHVQMTGRMGSGLVPGREHLFVHNRLNNASLVARPQFSVIYCFPAASPL